DDFYATYTIPEECPLIFVEDKVWLEGVVNGKVTIAAADVNSPGVDRSIVLNNNITYVNDESGLLAIAEEDMLVGLDVPNNMVLNGIFAAQKGRFGRNHYTSSGSYAVEETHNSDILRNSLTINGTIVSNGRLGTQWVNQYGTTVSGFLNRYNS